MTSYIIMTFHLCFGTICVLENLAEGPPYFISEGASDGLDPALFTREQMNTNLLSSRKILFSFFPHIVFLPIFQLRHIIIIIRRKFI